MLFSFNFFDWEKYQILDFDLFKIYNERIYKIINIIKLTKSLRGKFVLN